MKSREDNFSTPIRSGSASNWANWASAFCIIPPSATNCSLASTSSGRAIERADIVIATGGLGPTADDLTREALAAATDRPLVVLPEALEHIRAALSPGGSGKCPRATSSRPTFPQAAASCLTPTAPRRASTWTFPAADGGRCRFFALPGVPAEMREMWQGYLLSALRGMGAAGGSFCGGTSSALARARASSSRSCPISSAADRIPRVGINASRATIILRIVAEGESEEDCRAQIEPTVAEIHSTSARWFMARAMTSCKTSCSACSAIAARPWRRPRLPRPGWSPNGWRRRAAAMATYRGGLVAADEAAMTRLLPVDSAAGPAGGESFGPRWRLPVASGFRPISAWLSAPCPPLSSMGEAKQVHFALASAGRRADLSCLVGHPSRHCRRLLCQARDQPYTARVNQAVMARPEVIVVGGANGAGKTTFALKLAALRGCPYLGADAIASELSPGKPELAAVAAGKEFIRRLAKVIDERKTAVVESTLSGRSLRRVVLDARNAGFEISIVYIFLNSADVCIQRVAERVQKGGHSVPETDIRRRFLRSLGNFWRLYRPLADNWTLLYNAGVELVDVASSSPVGQSVREEDLYSLFQTMVKMASHG